jgi:hypothetical protein
LGDPESTRRLRTHRCEDWFSVALLLTGARRLQPHYIKGALCAGFTRLSGKIRREQGRFEITPVPAQLRTFGSGPIATGYDSVTFNIEHMRDSTGGRGELLAPVIRFITPPPTRPSFAAAEVMTCSRTPPTPRRQAARWVERSVPGGRRLPK